jgi:hypothetical protein
MSVASPTFLANDMQVPDVAVEGSGDVLAGVMAEYDNVDDVYAAAEKVRDAGYSRWDVHSPFPIHGIERAMAIRPTLVPWICLIGGLTGMALGTFLTHYTMGVEVEWAGMLSGYAFLESGKPLWSTPQFIPPIFELTILFAAFSAGLGMLLLNALPMLYNPLFKSRRFRRVTDDRFFVVIDATDPVFDEERTPALLRETKPVSMEYVVD